MRMRIYVTFLVWMIKLALLMKQCMQSTLESAPVYAAELQTASSAARTVPKMCVSEYQRSSLHPCCAQFWVLTFFFLLLHSWQTVFTHEPIKYQVAARAAGYLLYTAYRRKEKDIEKKGYRWNGEKGQMGKIRREGKEIKKWGTSTFTHPKKHV